MGTEILADEYDAYLDADAGATTANSFYVRNGQVVMAMNDADAAADNVFVYQADCVQVPKASGEAWAPGDELYYDSAEEEFTKTASGNAFAGFAVLDAASADTEGELNLNPAADAVGGVAAGASFTVGDEDSNAINVAVQLTDRAGVDLAEAAALPFYLSDDDAGQTPSGTAPDGGIAIGTDGALIEHTDNVAGLAIFEADGALDIDITESGTETFYLNVVLPNGKIATSGAITFA